MKILVATPVYANILDSRMVSSFIALLSECNKRKDVSLDWDRPSSPLLAYNRNVSAHLALQNEVDWLLFWDSDTQIDPADFVFGMIETAFKHDTPVVGLPCRLKTEDKRWNFAHKVGKSYINGRDDLPTEPFEVDVIGTGVMLIKGSLLKELEHPYFTIIDTFSDKPGFFPEDWTFCEKVKQGGYKIMADPRFQVKHWGTHAFV